MIKAEWGTKRACNSCTARFYDLRRSPAICPKCGETYETQNLSRRVRGRMSVVDNNVITLEDDILSPDLDLPDDLSVPLEDEEGLIEDTSDLGEDLEDMAIVIDNVNEGDEP